MITIDIESKKRKKLPIDIDHMSDQYISDSGDFIFPSPALEVIERNLFFLMRNSTKKSFESKYIMRPSYLSYDEYNTVALSPLLMYVNSVFSIEDFNLNEVIIPSFSSIVKICADQFPNRKVDDLERISW